MIEENGKFEKFIRIIKKRMWLILIITISFTLIVGLLNFYVLEPRYEAKVKVFIGKEKAIGEEVTNC